MEGQHQSPFQLVSVNITAVLSDVTNKLRSAEYSNNIDFARYKIDWVCTLLLRVGRTLEDSLLRCLLEVARMPSTIDKDSDDGLTDSPPAVKTGCKGRPRFDIPSERLEYLLQNGFKVTDIAEMLCVSVKTVYRRLEENGMSVRNTYASITDEELDDIIKSVLHDFPNSGYKSMRGQSLSRILNVFATKQNKAS